MISLLLAAILALPAHAQEAGEFNSACFLGLNDADTPATLGNCEAQAALNVESNLKGTAILKRKGFSKTADLTISTGPVNGSHTFIDSSGNRKDIVCQDNNCSQSTNGNAFSVFLTTATAGITRWSIVDVGGVAYFANNKQTPISQYDGTTLSNPAGMPQGSILELTQDRLVIGDISGAPNRVHYSSAGAYAEFTVGIEPEDSYFDEIGAPGDRIRGLRHQNGVLHIFKTSSLTDCELGDQYTTRCAVVLPNLGTTDPASIITAGSSLFFRGQDKNYWETGPNGLRQISQKIPNLVKSQSGGLGGGENSNTQTTQADWQNGIQFPTGTWNTTTSPGSIFPSSVTLVDTSTDDFVAGNLSNATTGIISGDGSVLGGILFLNTGFESSTIDVDNWTRSGQVFVDVSSRCGSASAGSFTWGKGNSAKMCSCAAGINYDGDVLVLKASDNSTLYRKNIAGTSDGGCNSFDFDVSTQPINIKMRFKNNLDSRYIDSQAFSTHSLVVGKIQYGLGGVSGGCSCAGQVASSLIFDMPDPFYLADSTFTSRAFDTAFSTPTWGVFRATVTLGKNTTAYFSSESSSDGMSWDAPVAFKTDAKGDSYGKKNIRYKVNFKRSLSTTSAAVLAMELNYATTGFYTTQCIQPNSSISSWGTLSCAETLAGTGSIVYYATSAATCAELPSADPGSWQTSIANNATVTIDTNTAVKIGWRSLLGSATDQAQIDACTLSWNEGAPSQPSWAVYDSIKNAIYWTTTIDGAASANRLLKYDLNLGYWYPFDIPAQAPMMINNSLYFGGASSGTWNQYGLVDSDAGGSINAYWQGKDVGADRPFVEKDFGTASVLSRNNQAGSMTATYTFSNAESGTYSISLSTGPGITYARSNFNLPRTSPQTFMSLKLGNNNTTPFEILGLGITWAAWPWTVTTE